MLGGIIHRCGEILSVYLASVANPPTMTWVGYSECRPTCDIGFGVSGKVDEAKARPYQIQRDFEKKLNKL